MLIDLSHTIAPGMLQVPSAPPVEVCRVSALADGKPYNGQTLTFGSHSGTHIDAPVHVFDGLATIESFAADRFIGPGVVVAVSKAPREYIGAEDLEVAAAGRVRPGDMLLLYTGWGERFQDPAYLVDYPSLTVDAADWLLEQQVRLLALDTLSPDLPRARRAPDAKLLVHERLLGNDVLIAENLTGLAPLVGRRLHVYALPLKIAEGDGAPARIVVGVVNA